MEQQELTFENIVNYDERGRDIIVFNIGSYTTKFGFASQANPFIHPTAIAYRRSFPEETLTTNTKASRSCREEMLRVIKGALPKQEPLINFRFDSANFCNEINERVLYSDKANETASFDKTIKMSIDVNEDLTENKFKWAEENSKVLYGREALSISDYQNYDIHFPVEKGYFNPQMNKSQVVDDLMNLIKFFCFKVLGVNRLDEYSVVLVLNDLPDRSETKDLLNLLLKNLKFKAAIVHLESVLATFGGALQQSWLNCKKRS